jgi:hypothetical protein
MRREAKFLSRMLTAGSMAVLVVVLLVCRPAPSAASGRSYCETTWYSDATFTTVVGERTTNCQLETFMSGTTSAFKIKSCEPCG